MAIIKNNYFRPQNDVIHLRDARHAHNFYKNNGFEFAPKVKFLYHVVFELTPYALSTGSASVANTFSKEISVLVKTSDLPGFTSSTVTKQQYNRKKNVQTRIDYDPVSITFHDDNNNVTSKLFEQYYKYYFRDGHKFTDPGRPKDYGTRDTYGSNVPKYGMDQPPVDAFFKTIKIFQLSRQRWRAYTLINPLVDKWQHDGVDASEGAGIMENSMSVLYEGVLYSEGNVGENLEPSGFGTEQTVYDLYPSPLGTNSNYPDLDRPWLIDDLFQSTIPGILFGNTSSIPFDNPFSRQVQNPGGYPNIQFPRRSGTGQSSRLGNSSRVDNLDTNRIERALRADSQVLNSFVNKALMTGNLRGFSVNNFSDFTNLAPNTRNAVVDELLGAVTGGNRKLQQIASQAIRRASR